MGSNIVTAINIFWRQNLNFAIKIIKKVDFEKSWPFSLIVPKLGYKYLNFQILVIKVYFFKNQKNISSQPIRRIWYTKFLTYPTRVSCYLCIWFFYFKVSFYFVVCYFSYLSFVGWLFSWFSWKNLLLEVLDFELIFVLSFCLFLVLILSLIHIWRCRRLLTCRSRWSPYH